MFVVGCCLAYLAIGIGVTVWVAKTLHRNGRIFLVDTFRGNEELADSVNHLFVVGFYLINIGWIALTLRTGAEVVNLRQSIELVSDKTGAVLLVLGVMHFGNLLGFSKLRGRSLAAPPRLPAV